MNRRRDGTESRSHTAALLLLLVLAGVGLGFVLIEGFVRVVKRDIAFQPDPDLIRSLRPNVTRRIYSYDTEETLRLARTIPPRPAYLGMDYTNNVGLRMREPVGPKVAGERRILLLGDSFTEADGVPDEQRFYRLVEERLRALPLDGVRWRVLNAAIQNGAPSQYVLQARRFLPAFQPDVVLVVLAPNDLEDDGRFERDYGFEFDQEGIPVRPRARLRLWLLQKVWSLRYFEVFLGRRFPRAYPVFFPATSPGTPVVDWLRLVCTGDPEARRAFLEKTGRYLRRLKQMAEARGADFAVFMIHYMWVFDDEPLFEPAYPGLRAELAARRCGDDRVRLYNAFVENFLRDSGIRAGNSYDGLLRAKRRDPRTKLWNFYDYHFSPAGHVVIADEMSRFLRQIVGRGD